MGQDNENDKKARWLVVLGAKGEKCYKTQKHIYVKGGKWSSPFPMVVYVSTEEEANDVLSFEPAIPLIMRAETLQEKAQLAMSLPGWDTILQERNETINDAIDAVNLTDRPIWRKVAPFGRAIAYMLTKGESEKPANKDWQDLLESSMQAVRLSSPERRAVPPDPAPARSPSPLPAPPTTPRKLRPGSVRWSEAQQDYVFSPPASGTPQPTPDPGPSQSHIPAEIFEDPTFNELIFPTPHHAVDLGPGFVYQHVRNLRGIKSTHSVPVADRLSVPSCGSAADTFLQAFGYDVESKVIVERELSQSVEMGDFVRRMSAHGLPVLEAKYIWYLYEYGREGRAYYSDTHIM
ncbi:hypothetical protein OH76DRAFT_1486797 [Lentinus brumalis]|uniref:Uncharacterized protein n=1 Tax=Lentinus brumalis TaxID=2498619 RepID=A0A371CWW6_9APHY|nr:hypothetical protein OH76DRAFT_1486797 [Polyporus brumalis]